MLSYHPASQLNSPCLATLAMDAGKCPLVAISRAMYTTGMTTNLVANHGKKEALMPRRRLSRFSHSRFLLDESTSKGWRSLEISSGGREVSTEASIVQDKAVKPGFRQSHPDSLRRSSSNYSPPAIVLAPTCTDIDRRY